MGLIKRLLALRKRIKKLESPENFLRDQELKNIDTIAKFTMEDKEDIRKEKTKKRVADIEKRVEKFEKDPKYFTPLNQDKNDKK
jgi:hypothetical protein